MSNLPVFNVRSDQPIQLSHQINPVLTQDNYLMWKSQVLPSLRGHGLTAFVDGSKSPPPEQIHGANGKNLPNPAFNQWRQQDQLILAWIFRSISPPILAQVLDRETSHQLWQRLQKMHSMQSLDKVLDLKLQLQTSKKGEDSCAQFLQRMQLIADRLRSIGSEITDQDLVSYTLQGLGSDYETFVTAISTREEPTTMPELHSLLLAHEAQIQCNLRSLSSPMVNAQCLNTDLSGHGGSHPRPSFPAGQTSTTPLATQSTFTNNQLEINSNSNKGKGSFRGKGRGRGSGSNTDKSIQCQICLKWGHDASKCYQRFDIRYSGEPQQQLCNTLGECKYTIQEADAHTDSITCVRFSPSALLPVIVSGSWDRTVKVWNSANCKLRYTLTGHSGYFNAVAISPDGSLCASGGKDGVTLLWDLAEGKRLKSLDAGAIIHALCFSPNRYWLCAATENSVQIWDLESKDIVQDLKPDQPPSKYQIYCTSLDWSVDGNTLFAGYSNGTIRVWDVTGGNYYNRHF